MTQFGETMVEMPSATSAMSPSVTATTTTWASARAPAASVSFVVQGQPRASPRGRAEASVRLTTCRMSWPARFQTGANSRETWPAPMSTMRSSATARRFALTDAHAHGQERSKGHEDAAEPEPSDLGEDDGLHDDKSFRTLSCSHTVISTFSCSGSNASIRKRRPHPLAS